MERPFSTVRTGAAQLLCATAPVRLQSNCHCRKRKRPLCAGWGWGTQRKPRRRSARANMATDLHLRARPPPLLRALLLLLTFLLEFTTRRSKAHRPAHPPWFRLGGSEGQGWERPFFHGANWRSAAALVQPPPCQSHLERPARHHLSAFQLFKEPTGPAATGEALSALSVHPTQGLDDDPRSLCRANRAPSRPSPADARARCTEPAPPRSSELTHARARCAEPAPPRSTRALPASPVWPQQRQVPSRSRRMPALAVPSQPRHARPDRCPRALSGPSSIRSPTGHDHRPRALWPQRRPVRGRARQPLHSASEVTCRRRLPRGRLPARLPAARPARRYGTARHGPARPGMPWLDTCPRSV